MENYNALHEEIEVYQKELTGFCNEKLKEFEEFSNAITVSASNSIKEMIETLNEKLHNSSDAKKLIDDFNLEVMKIISQAQNDLLISKNNFINTLNDETIEEIKDIIEAKKQEALLQINKSENAAVYKLTETYDLGVSTILSAEKTSLSNLKLLTEELIESLKLSSEGIDKKIQEKLETALKEISGLENDIINSIKYTETSIKEGLKAEAEKIVAEMEKSLEQIKINMENYSVLLKKELTEHKNLLIQEVNLDKENFFIEMDQEKNRILEEVRTIEYQIHVNLSKREQEIISNVISVIDGYDLEIEIIKQAKINEFINAIRYIYEEAVKSFNDTMENCNKQLEDRTSEHIEELLEKCNQHIETLQNLTNTHSTTLSLLKDELSKQLTDETTQHKIDVTNTSNDCIKKIGTEDTSMYDEDTPSVRKDAIDAINKKKEDNVDAIVGEASDLIKDFISTLTEQRYTCVLPPNTTLIQLPSDFSLGHRVRLYIDGILLILDNHYSIDKLKRTITLTQPYNTHVDVHVTEDLPDVNIQSIKDQLYIDGEEYKKNTLQLFEDESARHTTNFDNHFQEKKTEIDEYTEDTAKASADKYINETGKVMIDNYVESDSYIKINSHTDIKITQLNEHTSTKESQLNEHTLKKEEEITNHTKLKKNELNEYTLKKEEELNIHTSKKEEEITQHTSEKITEITDYVTVKKTEISEYTENQKPLLNAYTIEKKDELDAYNIIKKNDQDVHNENKKSQLDTYVDTVSKISLNAYVQETSKIDINNHVGIKKEEISEHVNSVTQESIVKIEEKKKSSMQEMIDNSIDNIVEYIASIVEQQFSCEQEGGNSVIQLPAGFLTNVKTKLYIDGKLQNLDKHYTINKTLNTINLIEPYLNKTDIFVITDYPTNDYTELKNKINSLETLVETLKKEIEDIKNGGTTN